MKSPSNSSFFAFTSFVLVVLLTACAPPAYDQTADQQLSKLQRDLNGHSIKLLSANSSSNPETRKQGDFDQNEKFYDQAEADIDALRIRMLAVPSKSTDTLTANFDNLSTNLLAQKAEHKKEGRLTDPKIKVWRNAYTVQLTALLQYELGLKSGKTGDSK